MRFPLTCWIKGCLGGILGLLLVMTSTGSRASVAEFEGTRTYSIFPQVTHSDASTGRLTFLVGMTGGASYPPGAVAAGRIVLGKGLTWVAGDTVHIAHLSPNWKGPEDWRWSVTVRADRGQSELRTVMRVDVGAGRIDEMESTTTIFLDDQGLHTSVPQTVREETVRNGQRFRHGGEFLVPIDGPEYVTADDVEVRAAPTKEVPAICATCKSEEAKLTFVVFVDENGDLRSYRALGYGAGRAAPSPAALEAAALALRQWKFSPGKTGTRTVADYAIVQVEVKR